MTRAGYTKAPCHGCGSTFGRPKDGLCQDCSQVLREAKAAQAARAEALSRSTGVYRTTQRGYAMPYVQHDSDSKIRNPLLEISKRLSVHVPWNSAHDPQPLWLGKQRYDFEEYREFEAGTAELLRQLWAAIQAALNNAHADGAESGRNLLMGLASGKITNDEFNTTAARMDRGT